MCTTVPRSLLITECQSLGTGGSVHSKSHAASMGARLTQPWLRTRAELVVPVGAVQGVALVEVLHEGHVEQGVGVALVFAAVHGGARRAWRRP